MYKVLLVDDEPYSIEGLKTMFNWSDYNFTVCGTAGDGKTALDYISCLSPDLVITDIRMPELDGLQLIEQAVKDLKSDAKFIVLSGYSDFTYAQTAMRYGVSGYLLKPLDVVELNEIIIKVIGEIKKQENVQKRINKKLSYIVNSSITRLLSGETKESIIRRLEFILDIRDNKSICFLLIDIDEPRPACDFQYLKNSIRKIIETALGEKNRINLYEDSNGRFCIIATYGIKAYKNPASFYNDIKNKIYENSCASVSMAVSSYVDDVRGLSNAYDEASSAIKHTFYLGEGNIIFYRDIANKTISYDFCAPEYSLLLNSIRNCQKEDINHSVDLIFNEFINKNVSKDIVWHYLLNIQAEIVAIIQSSQTNCDDFINKLISENIKMEQYCLPSLKQGFAKLANEVADYLSKNNDNSKDIIEKVKEFIDENYYKNIKLQSISEIFSINSVYLGQLFKKTTGMLFTDYLHCTRIENAKKLLRRTNMKISEISKEIGYSDPEYFVTKFKALTKLTPSEYKKNCNHN